MASLAQWIEGARPRTLPAAVAPVLAGAAVAVAIGKRDWFVMALCLVVSLMLQIGVNYANDYSDGIRGTDADRVGPMRLVGSGAASPGVVKAAAFVSFGVAALAGLAVVVLSGHWWLLGVGAAAIVAAWFYTGGSRPYGYLGLGELFVFIFFGLVAVAGTTFVIADTVPLAGWLAAVSIGALSSAILVANNLRDIVGDKASGKLTLATRLGDQGTRLFFVGLVVVAFVLLFVVALLASAWAMLSWAGLPPAMRAISRVRAGATGRDLIGVLRDVGFAELGVGVGLLVGALVWVM